MRWVRSVEALLLLALLAPGCAFNRLEINAADFAERVRSVEPGKTPIAEVERLAGGGPTSIMPLGNKRVYVWSYGEAKTAALALIVLNISKTNTGIDTALFLADENGIVEWMKVGSNSQDLPWEWWAFGD